MRYLLDRPLTQGRPAIEAGFIDEDKPLRIEPRLLLLQGHDGRRRRRPGDRLEVTFKEWDA
jgi:hypothetical protein